MSNITGKRVFTDPKGVQYLLEKYLTPQERDSLRDLNNEHTRDQFERELIKRLERGSGSGNWIPSNYTDELVTNASAIIGTNREKRKLKKGTEVETYRTRNGQYVYEDKKGKLRDYYTGRFVSKKKFQE